MDINIRPLGIHRLIWIFTFSLILIFLSQNLIALNRVHNVIPQHDIFLPLEIVDDPSYFLSPQNPPNKKQRKPRAKQQAVKKKLPPRIDPTWLLARLQSTTKRAFNHAEGPANTTIPSSICRIPPGDGDEGRRGYQAVNKIRHSLVTLKGQPQPPTKARVLCIVLTNSNQHDRLTSIFDTYAQYCDGVVTFSNATDPSKGVVSLAPLWNTSTNTDEDYDWIHSHPAILYVDEYYRDEYDAFHFAPEDTYVVVDHLRSYLTLLRAAEGYDDKTTHLYLGAQMPVPDNPRWFYCDGRAGFTLNRALLSRMGAKFSSPSGCGRAKLPVDQRIADCFYRDRIACADTSHKQLGSRYHPFTIHARANLFPENKNASFPWNGFKFHKSPPKGGTGGIHPETISFRSNDHRRYHAILHGTCDSIWEKRLGALDEHGHPGYVHNVTYLKSHPPPFNYTHGDCDAPFGNGTEGSSGIKGLRKIKIAAAGDKKVLCMVYTHSERHDRVRAIAETYGPRCDGFFAASNLTDRSIGAVHLLHEGPELYSNMWLKVRAMFEYAYDHYLQDFDFFIIGGDDYYVIAENLKYLVSTGNWKGPWNQSQPLFLGGSLISMPYTRKRYCGGGAGYTINRLALQLLIEKLWRHPSCWPHHQASDEDRIVASCFDEVGLKCMDTNDVRNETT